MESSSQHASSEHLRVQAAQFGIEPAEGDFAAVRRFLEAILPALAEIERRLPPSTPGGDDVPEGGTP